jgi:hypothetical protein
MHECHLTELSPSLEVFKTYPTSSPVLRQEDFKVTRRNQRRILTKDTPPE